MNIDNLKRMPLFHPFFFIAGGLRALCYDFPLWLVGYWWCADCGKRYGPGQKALMVQHGDICKECKKGY